MEQWEKNLYICWFTQIISLTGFGFMLPFIPLFIQTLGITSSTELRVWVGLLTAAPSLLMGIMAPIWGIISDRVGRKIMMLRAMSAGAIIISLMALAQNVQTVLILRICQGLFTGTITASATLVASGTPRHKLSYALGLLSSSTYIGFSFGPFIGGLCAEFLGYRISFFIGSFIISIGLILVLIFIKEIKAEDVPADTGAKHFSLQVIFRKSFFILFLIMFLLRFSRTMPVTFLPLYIQGVRGTIKGTSAITGIILALTGVVTALSGFTVARLGDKHDRLMLLAAFLGIGAVAAFPIFFTGSFLWSIFFYLIAIYFIGAVNPILQSHLSSNVHPGNRGVLFGLLTSAGNIGWFFSPLAGSAIAIYWSIKHIFLFFSMSLFITFLIIAVYRIHMNRVEKTH